MNYTSQEVESERVLAIATGKFKDGQPLDLVMLNHIALLRAREEAKPFGYVRSHPVHGVVGGLHAEPFGKSMSDGWVDVPLFDHPPTESAEAKDAARYRWLRDTSNPDSEGSPYIAIDRRDTWGECTTIWQESEVADQAIDAAMTAESREGEGS